MSAFRNLSLHRMRGNKRYPKKVHRKYLQEAMQQLQNNFRAPKLDAKIHCSEAHMQDKCIYGDL
jgi:hypothetical protein